MSATTALLSPQEKRGDRAAMGPACPFGNGWKPEWWQPPAFSCSSGVAMGPQLCRGTGTGALPLNFSPACRRWQFWVPLLWVRPTATHTAQGKPYLPHSPSSEQKTQNLSVNTNLNSSWVPHVQFSVFEQKFMR